MPEETPIEYIKPVLGKEIPDYLKPFFRKGILTGVMTPNIIGGSLRIGSGDSVLKYDTANGLWLGNSTFASAPFRVNLAGAVTATSITITSGDLTNSFLNANSVNTAEIVDAAVETAKLNDLSVTTGKIAALAVTTAKIDNLAVTNAKIDSLAVSKLTAGAITSKVIELAFTDTAGDVAIRCGKTDFGDDSTSGFIWGIDDSVAGNPVKLEMGSSATKIFKYDGTDVILTGGTITGGTIQTASSGQRVLLDGTNNQITFYDPNGDSTTIIKGTNTGYQFQISSTTSGTDGVYVGLNNTTSTGTCFYGNIRGYQQGLYVTNDNTNVANRVTAIKWLARLAQAGRGGIMELYLSDLNNAEPMLRMINPGDGQARFIDCRDRSGAYPHTQKFWVEYDGTIKSAGDVDIAGAYKFDGSTIIDTNGYPTPKSSTDANAPNNSIYYSTDASKLVYKDSGGTANALY